MKSVFGILGIASFLLLLQPGTSRADELRVGIYPFPPYFSVSENGRLGGIWKVELDRKLKTLGHTAVYAHYPPPRLARNIIQGKTDVTISAHHIAVDDHVHYSDRPIAEITLNAYHKPDRPTVKSVADMKGKSVIVIRGYAYNGRIKYLRDPKNNITVIDAVSHIEAIRRLQNGKADYLLDYRLPVEAALKAAHVPEHEISINEISRYSVYFVVSKKTKDAARLANQLNATLPPVKKTASDH
jgi:polar amino acid transport system substrate-binding protein